MGSLRKLGTGLCLMLVFQAPSLCAQILPGSDPLRLFATCTGRLSALMEHQWLVQDKGAEATAARRDQMLALLGAASALGNDAMAMDLRLQAKVAEAALLSQATFGTDPDRARQARQRAEALVDACLALLLSEARA